MSGPGPYAPPPWYGHPGPPGPRRPPTSWMAVVGRVITILGLCAAVIACLIWIGVGGFAVMAGPLCVECAKAWLPPVALGVLGPLLPIAIWTIALIRAWRHWSLMLWSLVGWPILGAINVRAIEWFVTLFDG